MQSVDSHGQTDEEVKSIGITLHEITTCTVEEEENESER